MKKIALLMDGWKRYMTYAFPSGILQRLRETGEEANLYIFNSFGNWSRDEEYNRGEYNIFHLPDLREFDGIILDVNNIRHTAIAEQITGLARSSGKPVLSLERDVEDFYYVGINNFAAMQEVMEHLYDRHGCRRFWFIMGPEDNYENIQRVEGITDFLHQKKIACRPEDFYYGDFGSGCGESGFMGLLKERKELPDAVVCANDNIAVGVCLAAERMGYRVPQDFRVTGFDNFDKARYFEPSITTVGRIREEVGYDCVDILRRIWAGEEVPHFHYTGTSCVFLESCGCEVEPEHGLREHSGFETDENFNTREYAKRQIIQHLESDEFDEEILGLQYELMKCTTFQEMLYALKKSMRDNKCAGICLALDEHLEQGGSSELIPGRPMSSGGFLNCGYPKQLQFMALQDEKWKAVTQISALFPTFEEKTSGNSFLFLPLHFGEETVGYFAMKNGEYFMANQYAFQIANALMAAMENLYRKLRLQTMNRVLADMYVRDGMTGLYNRQGYHEFAERFFLEQKQRGEGVSLLYLDLDRLKYMNDNYGHEMGDFALKAVASAMMTAVEKDCGKEGLPIRLGGDEFLIVGAARKPKELAQMADRIRLLVQEAGEKEKLPFPLELSIGCIVTESGSNLSLEEYVNMADERMYEEKRAKKVART